MSSSKKSIAHHNRHDLAFYKCEKLVNVIVMYVVSGFERNYSLPESQSVCLRLWVYNPPVVMKSLDKIEILYYLKQRW